MIDAEQRPAARTEVEVAADTVAALIAARVILSSKIAEATEAAGLMAGEVRSALERRRAGGGRPPRRAATADAFDAPPVVSAPMVPEPQPVPDPPAQPDPEPDPQPEPATPVPPADTPPPHPNAGRTPWNKKPEGETRECIRCELPKPIDQFLKRSDSNSRRTECDDCRKKYSRDRYLSVEMSQKLGPILRFILEHDDPIVGQVCGRCQHTFSEGDEVEAADVVIHHHNCEQEA